MRGGGLGLGPRFASVQRGGRTPITAHSHDDSYVPGDVDGIIIRFSATS